MSACFSCGVATSGPDVVTIQPIAVDGGVFPGRPSRGNLPSVSFGQCEVCADRHALAGRMIDADPRAVARIGSRSIAAHRLECALDALAAVGMNMPKVGEEIGPLVEHLSNPGGGARWSSDFGPVRMPEADPNASNDEPWEHATDLQPIRDGVARMLAERFASSQPSKQVAPPPPSVACLFCGVGTVEASALRVARLGGLEQAAERLWKPINADAQTFGASRRTKRIEGHLCSDCTSAAETEGSIGHQAMKLALMRHLKTTGHRGELSLVQSGEVEGLKPWAVLGQSEPNESAWGHLVFP